jgi:hypothetical protein
MILWSDDRERVLNELDDIKEIMVKLQTKVFMISTVVGAFMSILVTVVLKELF